MRLVSVTRCMLYARTHDFAEIVSCFRMNQKLSRAPAAPKCR